MMYLALPEDAHREPLSGSLKDAGYDPVLFTSARTLFFAIKTQLPRLLLLGTALDDMSGLEFLSHLRADQKTRMMPIIMLSLSPSAQECIDALDGGADDYVGCLEEPGEVVSRVRAMLRRIESVTHGTVIEYEGITLDDERRCVLVEGKQSPLTFTEYEILKLLIRDPGEVLTRSRILERVWGTSSVGETRAVDMHIAALRRKLGACGALIQTMRGTGYLLGRNAN